MSSSVPTFVPTQPTATPPPSLANYMMPTARDVSSDAPAVLADQTDRTPKAPPPGVSPRVLAMQMTNTTPATMPNPTALLSASHRPGMPGTGRFSSPVRDQRTQSKPLVLPQTSYQPTGNDLKNQPQGDANTDKMLAFMSKSLKGETVKLTAVPKKSGFHAPKSKPTSYPPASVSTPDWAANRHVMTARNRTRSAPAKHDGGYLTGVWRKRDSTRWMLPNMVKIPDDVLANLDAYDENEFGWMPQVPDAHGNRM